MTRYLTENSEWLIDRDKKLYRRMPLNADPPEPETHRIIFDTWLPFETAEVVESMYGPVLHIMAPDSVLGVFSSPIVVCE